MSFIGKVGRSALGLALSIAYCAPALALDNDPSLAGLCVPDGTDPAVPCGNTPVGDQSGFRSLTREYAMALAPRILSPADTLGVNGFQFNIQTSLTSINSGEDYWQKGISDGDPPSMLVTTALDMRKGLPYSFEIGANANYIMDSELIGFTGSLKWAPNEAIDAFPVDVAVRTSVTRIVGSADMSLTMVTFDAVVSRKFGIVNLFNLAPYMGYSPVLVYARSGVLDPTPGDATDPSRSFVFEKEDQVIHRFVVGCRLLAGAVNFTPEALITKGLQTYAFNLGLDF